jgi:Kef-type K+ transport system membrane component KefB
MTSFLDLALVFAAAAVLGWLATRWRQPLMIAYVAAGFLLVGSGFSGLADNLLFSDFAQIGVVLLLFLIGLKLSLHDLQLVGPEALRLGLSQMVITFVIFLIVSSWLGFRTSQALFLSSALTFSSTIVVVRLLNEKKELVSLHGKLTVGLLLLQDLVVLLVMVALSGFGGEGKISPERVLLVVVEMAGLFLLTVILAKKPVPWLFSQLAQSTELLFISSIAWCFTVSAAAYFFGFPPEIGAFLAGVGLANTPLGVEIAAKVGPLRDFFLSIFFILLGIDMGLSLGMVNWRQVLVFTPLVLVLKPVVVFSLLLLMGYRRRTAFLSGLLIGQVSEFSLILLRFGERLEVLTPDMAGTLVMVSALSIGVSASYNQVSDRLFVLLRRYLPPLGPPSCREEISSSHDGLAGHAVLVGCDRSGSTILPVLVNLGLPLVVVDFNPAVIRRLNAEKIQTLYGDIGDDEILARLNLEEARLVVSTVTDWHDNLVLLAKVRDNKEAVVILTAATGDEAIEFYHRGADYVVVPEIAGGEHLSSLLTHHSLAKEEFGRLGRHHYRRLFAKR